MIYPKLISKNGCIGVCAPSSGLIDKKSKKYSDLGTKKLEKEGYKVIFSKNCFNDCNGRSADAKTRADEFLKMFSDKDIDLIISLSGGEYEMEILDYLTPNKIKKNPKYFIGHSDNSILTFLLTTKFDISSIYGYNLFELAHDHKTIENFISFLKGNKIIQKDIKKASLKDYDFFNENINIKYKLDYNKSWIIKKENSIDTNGIMIGGLLEDLTILCGTKYDNVKEFINKYKKYGFIWYFDICLLDPESVKRAFFQLRNAGWFRYCKLIMISRPINQSDSFGISYMDNIYNELSNLSIPVLFNADFGHIPPRVFAVNGALANVKYDGKNGTIEYKKMQ